MNKKVLIFVILILGLLLTYRIYNVNKLKEEEYKILELISQEKMRESSYTLLKGDDPKFNFKKRPGDYSQEEYNQLLDKADSALLQKNYNISIYDSLYGVNTNSEYYLQVAFSHGFMPTNKYKKSKKIDFNKLKLRNQLKLKPYNSDNIYDKNFFGIFMFSRVMFNGNGEEALVEMRSSTKEESNNDKLLYLKKNEENEWKIEHTFGLPNENNPGYKK